METNNQTQILLQQMQKEEDPAKYADALGLLEKLVTNLLTNPDEEKYKHIKTTVKTLATRLFNIRLIPQLLQTIGFTQLDQEYILLDENFGTLIDNYNLLKWQNILAQAQLEGPQAIQKAQEIIRLQQEVQRKQEQEQREKERIQQQVNYQQQEKKLEKPKDSVANQLQFGAKVKTCEQMGIGKQQKGG